jgi:tetratricopeptide (TPR) repeat protein
MVKQPVPVISAAAENRLSYGWTSNAAPEVYAVVKNEPIASASIWYRLGSQLYESDHLAEALDCFAKIDSLDAGRLTRFAARGWRGLIEDIRGNRVAALERYKEALQIDPGEAMSLSGPRIKIDKPWLEARLQKPFVRESELSLPAQPTAADLIAVLDRMGYAHEGKSPLLIFEKTRGLEIKSSSFWFKLGMQLFDGGYYRESLASFEKETSLERSGLLAYAAWVWQGHLHDLLGEREQALACYREALKRDTGGRMQHDQYRMVIDREWIEARMKSPFTWNR